ncbi:PREDICTED: tetraspanin-9-like, partial [Cariama cristata]|uniref:tetraspanin-9-like n=1 Tax=Cariama cristata TaxID=54380 RepID=UPI00052013CE
MPVSILRKACSWSQVFIQLVNLPRCKAVSKASSKLGKGLSGDRRVTGEVKENNHAYDYGNISLTHAYVMLCGCGLLGVGIWLSVSQGNFATFSPSFPSLSAANLVIAIGTVIMVTGFLGCLGAIKENKCLLLSFFIVLLIILLAELILLILFFVYMDK